MEGPRQRPNPASSRAEIEEFAVREHHTMNNVSESFLEWGVAHLKIVDEDSTYCLAERSSNDKTIVRRTTGQYGIGALKEFQISLGIRVALRTESSKYHIPKIIRLATRPHCYLGRAMSN
jgi:hypothetical protein